MSTQPLNDSTNFPKVSVIMNCLNCSEYLREAIDSVYAQTYQDWEIIFWDNASSDNSAEIAKRYDSRLRYFRGEKTVSLGAARNKAVEQASGEFIAFLDCDDLWMPHKLEKQVPLFRDPKVGLMICDAIFFNNKGRRRQLYKQRKPPTGKVFRDLLLRNFICMQTMIIRKKVFEEFDHWFDTRFDLIVEYDFNIRLSYSWEIAYVDEVLAKWRVHADSWSWSRKRLLPKERRLMLNKLKEIIPNFYRDYQDEIRVVQRQIHWEVAKLLCEEGQNEEAYSLFKPYLQDGFLWRIRGMVVRLPYPWFQIFHRMVTKIAP